MAIDFPNSPATNSTHTVGSKTWKYDGEKWISVVVTEPISLGIETNGNYVQSLIAGTGITITGNNAESATPTISIGQSVAVGATPTFYTLQTSEDLYVGGDLHVTGTLITTTETSLAIEDPFIYLNDGSTPNNPDLGFAGNYYDGTYRHAGFFRDATDDTFKAFKGYEPEPGSPINTAHASYQDASIQGKNFISTVSTGTAPLTVSSTTEVLNLHADTATTLHSARDIQLSGDVSGTASFDGSANINISTTIDTISASLDDISDVNAATPSDYQVLSWDDGTSKWINRTFSASISSLDAIGDVTVPSPTSGEFLKWNGTAWVNSSVGASSLSGSTLASGVTASSLTSVGSLSALTVAGTTTLQQSLEKVTPGGNITGTTNINLLTSAVYTYTSTGAFTFNFRGDGSTTLNSLMTNDQAITIVVFITNTTARSLSGINIDGSSQTIKWFGGSAPTGNASATDVYTVTIIKTGSATYTVYASQSKFA